jgi:AraC-like DNA-binding protein
MEETGMPFEHVIGKLHFWYYQSPPARWHPPRLIEPVIEEIEAIVAGRGYFEVGGRVVDAGPGSLLWYQPGDTVIATSHETDPYETIVFRFAVTRRARVAPPAYSTWADPAECARFCRRARELFRLAVKLSQEEVVCQYARLFWEAQEHLRRGSQERLPASLRRVQVLIATRYADPWDVEQLAAAAGVSPSHLHLLFRRHLDTSPTQCLLQQRLLKAQDILAHSDSSVKEVCFAVGFRDFAHFCARFKRQTGMSPGAYRRRFASASGL